VWVPVWNIEGNRLEYLGPDTHPDLPAARAVRMAVALPVAAQPNPLGQGWWLDGGIVEILPAQPFVRVDRADVAVVVNCFYPSAFASPQRPRWREQTFSILHVASQTRIMQHLHLARRSLSDLQAAVPEVVLVEPVAYETVQGGGLYGQFVDTRLWPSFMAAGYQAAARTLSERYSSEPS
jgi:NTE family protein